MFVLLYSETQASTPLSSVTMATTRMTTEQSVATATPGNSTSRNTETVVTSENPLENISAVFQPTSSYSTAMAFSPGLTKQTLHSRTTMSLSYPTTSATRSVISTDIRSNGNKGLLVKDRACLYKMFNKLSNVNMYIEYTWYFT